MLAAKSASPLICGLSKPVSRSSRSCSIPAAMWAMPPVVERMKPSDPVEVEGIHNVSVTLLQILSGGEHRFLTLRMYPGFLLDAGLRHSGRRTGAQRFPSPERSNALTGNPVFAV